MTVFVGNTNVLELRGLKSAIEDAFINDATVALTIKDCHGAPVAGQTWPTPMIYIAGSNGDYRAIVEHDAALTARELYTAEISASDGENRVGFWRYQFKPAHRLK